MKHKHAELIKAWADGADIEIKTAKGWSFIKNPSWYHSLEYREKPKELEIKRFAIQAVLSACAGPLFYPVPDCEANLLLTFKGNKLMSAEVVS